MDAPGVACIKLARLTVGFVLINVLHLYSMCNHLILELLSCNLHICRNMCVNYEREYKMSDSGDVLNRLG